MEKLLLVYGTVLALVLVIAVFYAFRSDEAFSRRWAKVRVRVDERSRREERQPGSDDFDQQPSLEWVIVGTIMLLIVMLATGTLK